MLKSYIKSALKSFIDSFTNLIFPRRGGVSGVDFANITSEELWRILPRSPPLPAGQFPANVHAVLSYKHRLTRALIWQIKYKRDHDTLRHGGYIMARFLQENLHDKQQCRPIIIIPIPISSKRRKERGYNQCELLADSMQRNIAEAKSDHDMAFEIRNDILIRSAHTTRQTFKNRHERLESSHGIFSVCREFSNSNKDQSKIKTSKIIVIDDVLTTGSTMQEAINTLKKAGFKEVHGLTLAH